MSVNDHTKPRERWNWLVFFAVLTVALLLNVGEEFFFQIEKVLFLPPAQRVQTSTIVFGWPFPVATMEPFGLVVTFWESRSKTLARTVADIAVTVAMIYAASLYLSQIIHACQWRLDTASLLVALGVFATALVWATSIFSFQGNVGAFSLALFRCLDCLQFVFVIFTWHWVIKTTGYLVFTLALRRGTSRQKSNWI